MKPGSGKILAIFLALLLAYPAVAADKKEGRQRDAARRLAQSLKQVQGEKAQLEQEKAALNEQLQTQQKEADSIKSSLSWANRRLKNLQADLEALRKEKSELEGLQQKTDAALTQARGELEKTRKSLADTSEQLKAAQKDIRVEEGQRKELAGKLDKKEQMLAVAEQKNEKLHQFGLELIKIYEHPGLLESIARAEPFTQIKRVELENILQDYRDKLDDQHMLPSSQAAQ